MVQFKEELRKRGAYSVHLGLKGHHTETGRIKFKIACVGHPPTDLGKIDGQMDGDILVRINRVLEKRSSIIAYKGFGNDLPLKKFTKVAGLPVAMPRLSKNYWSELKSDRRHDLKSKLKKSEGLRYEERVSISDYESAMLYELYLNTYNRAPIKFEKLSPKFFLKMAPISRYLMFFEGEKLIGFVQLICRKPHMVFRYLGMDYDRSKQYGIYFLLFIKTIEICIRDGFTDLDSGATSYEFKRRIGSEMVPTYIYYHHTNPVVSYILGKVKFLLEPSAKELV